MKQRFKITILADELGRLLSRILIIFNRRNLVVKGLSVSEGENPELLHYAIEFECIDGQVEKLIKQIEKLIGVH